MVQKSDPRVMIIDDEPELGELLRELLQERFDAKYYRDPSLALEALKPGAWDLILTDLNMPHFSGKELIKALRLRDVDVPIVILTGLAANDPFALDAVEHGASGIITKPFHDADKLLDYLERFVK